MEPTAMPTNLVNLANLVFLSLAVTRTREGVLEQWAVMVIAVDKTAAVRWYFVSFQSLYLFFSTEKRAVVVVI